MDTAPIEPSSFAQFQIEQDRKFYAMFPEARPTNEWPLQSPSTKYFESIQFQRGLEAGAYVHTSNPATPAHSSISYVEDADPIIQLPPLSRHDIPSTSTLHYDSIYTSDQALGSSKSPTGSYSPLVRQASPPAPIQRDCATRRSSHNSMSSQCEVSVGSISQYFSLIVYLFSPYLCRYNCLHHLMKLWKAIMLSPHTNLSTSSSRNNVRSFNKLLSQAGNQNLLSWTICRRQLPHTHPYPHMFCLLHKSLS